MSPRAQLIIINIFCDVGSCVDVLLVYVTVMVLKLTNGLQSVSLVLMNLGQPVAPFISHIWHDNPSKRSGGLSLVDCRSP